MQENNSARSNPYSRIAYGLCVALVLATAFFYYPKWKQPATEATLSWDVSGYYLYLPAAFIYKDLKELKFYPEIEQKYHPGPGMGQAFKHPSGNYVMKYPMGQALQLLPWFGIGHLLAGALGYPTDGFSLPYQAAVSWGSLLVALLGLWVLRRILLLYFSDIAVAATLLCIGWGSNYLEYTAITGAMTHNWLFTLYALLIAATIRFYRQPTFALAAGIGLLVGWATITRPTEIITALIPLCWGLGNMAQVRARVAFFREHIVKVLVAADVAVAVIFIQLLYWKWATGEWIVYSYQEQGFSWLHPHLREVLISARAGWLVYSPVMLLAVAGLFFLRRRQPALFAPVLLICLLALYITAAWDIWWYGGSLGQRALIQSYPLWAFALAALWEWAWPRQRVRTGLVAFALLGAYINVWWTHQAHKGGYFFPEQMNTPYVAKVLGRWNVDREAALKLLDTREEFGGAARNAERSIGAATFEEDTTGGKPVCMVGPGKEFATGLEVRRSGDGSWEERTWVRAEATFHCSEKEWDFWEMTQFIVRFQTNDNKVVKERMIRLQRHVEGSEMKTLWFDTRLPDKPYDKIQIFFWNPGSDKTVYVREVKAELFRE